MVLSEGYERIVGALSRFVAKFNPSGPAIAYSKSFEAPIETMAIDSADVHATAGNDACRKGWSLSDVLDANPHS
jgi:hypothetical protein